MPLTTHEGVAISWDETGDPAAPPLLLIMGHVFGAGMWHRVVKGFAERFRVITYDNWGVGDSGWPRGGHTVERMARDAGAVLEAAGADRAHVFGMGMGGLVAQELAIATPRRVGALVLGSTSCPGAADAPLHSLPVSSFFRLERSEMYGPAVPDDDVSGDLAVVRATPVAAAGLKAQARAVASYRSFARVPAIAAPTLVVHGDVDTIVSLTSARELSERIPDADLMVVPATGHNLTTPYAGPLCDAVTVFLDRNRFTHGIPRQSG